MDANYIWCSQWECFTNTEEMNRINNSYVTVKEYFKNIVEQSKEIQGFAGFFSRDLHHKQGSFDGLPSPYLALFKYELGLDGSEQTTTAVRKIGFAVMRTDVAVDDYEAQYNAIDECERLALQVLSRIRFDNNNPKHLLYNALLKDSVRILPVELSSESYGVEVNFSLKNLQTLALNPDDWNDIDEVCK